MAMRLKLKWYHAFSIGSFVIGWITKAVAEKKDDKGEITEEFGIITPEEAEELGRGVIDMVSEIVDGNIDIKKI